MSKDAREESEGLSRACPFCGGVSIERMKYDAIDHIWCQSCDSEWCGPQAHRQWNRRTIEAELEREVLRLRAELAEARGRCDEMETVIKELGAHIGLGALAAISLKTMRRRRDAASPAEPDARGTTGEDA